MTDAKSPVLVEQFKNVVDDCVLGFGEEIRLRKGRLRNAGFGILQAKFGDDVEEVLCWYRGPSVPTLPQSRRSPIYWKPWLLRGTWCRV